MENSKDDRSRCKKIYILYWQEKRAPKYGLINMKISILLLSIISIVSICAESPQDIVKNEAKKKWPNDLKMQTFQIKNETAALNKLAAYKTDKVITRDVLEVLKWNASSEWPRSYKMQVFSIDKEIKACRSFDSYQWPQSMPQKVQSSIKNSAVEKWHSSYKMIVYAMTKQKDAWIKVQKYKNDPRVAGAAAKWPDDYAMQLYELNK